MKLDKMKKKVLLVTLEGTSNFGNRLQNYALKQVIESSGFYVDNMMIRTDVLSLKLALRNYIKTVLVHCGMREHQTSFSKSKRKEKFLKFNKKYLSNCVYMPTNEVQLRNWDSYAFAVTGSDQVWHNWHFQDILFLH